MEVLLLIPGFLLLIGGAEWLIHGASKLAKRLGVSELLIGLTVVAFGTSLPELIINVMAGSRGASELAIANVVGSNITNTLLILGIAALIKNLTVHRLVVSREITFNVLVSAMVLLLAADKLFRGDESSSLDAIDGLVLISYFLIFLYYIFGSVHSRQNARHYVRAGLQSDIPKAFLLVIVGSIAVSLGGKWIIDGALEIADWLNVSQALVGVTLVAIGTSIPELVTSLVAIRQEKVDIAIGNIIGSNLFNMMWVLGLSAFLSDLKFSDELLADTVFMLGISIVLLIMLTVGRYKHQLSRFEGTLLITMYAVYLITTVWESQNVFN
ncbi:MAG TPA: calcium/sodium antiporter [Candidatus Saccharimonadales bacterium]